MNKVENIKKEDSSLSKANVNKKGILYSIIKAIVTPFSKIFYFCDIKGKEYIPQSGSFILCCNHLSLVDVVFLVVSQKRKIHFMAKSELFQNKLLAKFFYSMGAFPVNRGKSDLNAINTAEEILKNGGVLGLFLEGTRSKDGELLKPKPGVAMIAYQTGSKVLPACITPKNGGKIRLFHKTFLSYSKPISPSELGLNSGNLAEIRNATRSVMGEIKELRRSDLQR